VDFDLYTPATSAELFTRWAQLAAMTAISRIHNSTIHGSRYPWDFDGETLDTYRRYARAKVRLVGLMDFWARRAALQGAVGPVRPLVLDDPSPAARSISDEWLLGTDILVAPVVVEGARSRRVYLPAGSRWEQVVVGADGEFVSTGRVSPGGQSIEAPAPLVDIPIFLRRGTT
jgi:alpha-glucosidase (family GH31 glycosyl hydrolase)